jgi:hypothetical protein
VLGLTNGMAILREHGSRRRGKEADDKCESRAFRSQTCHDVPIYCTEGAIERPQTASFGRHCRKTGKIPRLTAGNPPARRSLESRPAKQLRIHRNDDRAQ